MSYAKIVVGAALCCILALVVWRMQSAVKKDLIRVTSVQDVKKLFAHDAASIKRSFDAYLQDAQQQLRAIKDVPDDQRTFANTIQAFDHLIASSDLELFQSCLATLTYLHPDKALRDVAQEYISRISAFFVEVAGDKDIYQAVKSYAQGNAHKESLSASQWYYITTMIDDFKRLGLELPDEELVEVKRLNKELNDLGLLFEKNIAEDTTTIAVDAAGLDGVSPEFVATLEQDADGNYILHVDYPTIAQVMEHATSADTRKRLYHAFMNRAYPVNEPVMHELIAKRKELATRLGFDSFAQLTLEDQMAKSPERVDAFINDLLERAAIKAEREYDEMRNNLPTGATLSPEGKFYPWDVGYCRAHVKKVKYNLDERVLAEYFPVERALQGMLDLYAQFFSIRFESEPIDGLWIDGLTLLRVYKENSDVLLAYIVLDLYPRADKFSHAACQGIIPAVYLDREEPNIGVFQVMANFPQAQGDQPALFKRSDVTTFFHEFGHALHGVFGRTEQAAVAGMRVKRDFVEMPSQMLEEWMIDPAILKELSQHYQTGEPLSDEQIANILAVKNFGTGGFVQGQASYALFSLKLFGTAVVSDVNDTWLQLYGRINSAIIPAIDTHFFASFGHLIGYGAKYYGYLWSKVFALDLFGQVKEHGLRNPVIGQKYVDTVLSRGGSDDPYELLKNFLGREPNADAFFKDMGL